MPGQRSAARRHRPGWLGLLILGSVAAIGVIGPHVIAHDLRTHILETKLPPSWSHWLGTDDTGRDILALLLSSIWPAYGAGLVSAGLVFVLGTAIGLVAGYYAGWIDRVLRLIISTLMIIPELLLMLLVISLLTPEQLRHAGVWQIIAASAVAGVPGYALLVRDLALRERHQAYVVAAYALGLPPRRILFRYIAPNIAAPLLAFLAGRFKSAILVLSALNFIGIGYDPAHPALGLLLEDGRQTLLFAWWRLIGPLAVIFLTVLSVNMISDAAAE
jgi:ABC-type dipeptide/oligopeptide/nickel transport system permease subunit